MRDLRSEVVNATVKSIASRAPFTMDGLSGFALKRGLSYAFTEHGFPDILWVRQFQAALEAHQAKLVPFYEPATPLFGANGSPLALKVGWSAFVVQIALESGDLTVVRFALDNPPVCCLMEPGAAGPSETPEAVEVPEALEAA